MHMFEYLQPRTAIEAEALLLANEEARAISGGMSLLPAMKLRLAAPSHLIDLSGIEEMRGTSVDDNVLTIGAMTRHAEVARSSVVRQAIPGLAALASGIGDRQVRNRGTIGGSIANSDPAACYPASVLGLGATVMTPRRRIAADDFFVGVFETALEPGELVTHIAFPIPERSAYVKFQQPASRFALVGVLVSRSRDGTVRVAVTGASSHVFRVPSLEQALAAEFTPGAVENIAIDTEELNSDIHGDADYRAHLIPVLTARAVDLASKPDAVGKI
ncbi:xanthine dehydrogenase family protein subunit M [Corticibacterium sp. UT-5YL-CI-8]|nr:xanthine dehydrogenase family protein subunit M [Tianweitania sp. UT-5YL-CI-8]